MAYETEVSPLFAAAGHDVHSELRFHGFSEDEIRSSVTLVQGLFANTLPHAPDGRVALVHIDADLYQSYKNALNLLWSRVSVLGLVAFDEYEAIEDWPSARFAVGEFLATLPERSYDRKWINGSATTSSSHYRSSLRLILPAGAQVISVRDACDTESAPMSA